MMSSTQGLSVFQLGDFELDSGEVITDAFLGYKTFGNPQNPAIVHPTAYASSSFLLPREQRPKAGVSYY